MDRESSAARQIWRPSVELVGPAELPHPADSASQLSSLPACLHELQHYTKTSLKHDSAGDPVDQLNRRIREANQAHNSLPRPFAKRTSLVSPPLHQEPASFKLTERPVVRDSRSAEFVVQTTRSSNNQDFHHQQLDGSGRETMNSKLVHKQYNSPIDLYSMNNIRKTIEAQSELLAPGVKGINFMKADGPVNKQSEVYKLIKEEEEEEAERRRCQQQQQQHHHLPPGPAPLQQQQRQESPAALRPSVPSVPSVLISKHHEQDSSQQQHHERTVHYASERNFAAAASNSPASSTTNLGVGVATSQPRVERSLAEAIQQSMAGGEAGGQRQQASASDQPKCCECGQPIVGPFAKIQNRFVHPHCFNCSTCGSSLKNSGYFTINDKLYCDIHARQVANVMRLNNNFEPNKQTIDNTRQQYDDAVRHQQQQHDNQLQQQVKQQQQVVVRHQATDEQRQVRSTSRDDLKNQQQQQQQQQQATATMTTTTTAAAAGQRCSNCCVTLKDHSATISTMFSNRAGAGGCTCGRRSEIKWIWRPCQAQRQQESATSSAAISHQQQHQQHQIEHQHQQQQLQHQQQQHQMLQQHQQQLMRNRYESRLVTSSSGQASGSPTTAYRMPVCCHCQIQIHGPYILAGETVWCKPCSQTHFVCDSCHRSLLNVGFIEDNHTKNKYFCEHCFEVYLAPICAKCHIRIKDQDCLKTLGKTWHLNCFVCSHCKCQFGNSSFYLEDDLPYCERDWNLLFTTKCYACNYPIEAGDKWVEALQHSYHSDCFRCTGCQVKLEGSTFYCKGGKPYCRMHAR